MSAFVLFMCSHEYYCETPRRKIYVQILRTLRDTSRRAVVMDIYSAQATTHASTVFCLTQQPQAIPSVFCVPKNIDLRKQKEQTQFLRLLFFSIADKNITPVLARDYLHNFRLIQRGILA